MAKGKVKWFNPNKRYGFIEPEDGGEDIFVHISAVEAAGMHGLSEDQTIYFDVVTNKGRKVAENLRTTA